MTEQAPPPTFDSLNLLSQGVLNYVKEQGFAHMTPVQAATIPQFLQHKDVAAQAVTGSGKTLAFLIPVVEILQSKSRDRIGALILSPTRELAIQTHRVAQGLCQSCGLPDPLLLVGGSSSNSNSSRPVSADLQALQKDKPSILIGTCGRVEDFVGRPGVDCRALECLVLDEADVLLQMGFQRSLENILTKLPKMRRTALFSATTCPNNLKEWMKRTGMRNPVWIQVSIQSQQATPTTLQNYYVVTTLPEKLSRLVAFLQQHPNEKVIVFWLTCACVEFFGGALQQLQPDLNIETLHGKMAQNKREKTMERFREAGGCALFCTDVAARGLDVSDVHWVVQFDAPQDPSFFVHRVGRTGRAGREGSSLVFLTHKEEAYVEFLKLRKVPLEPLPSTERCVPPDDDDPKLTFLKSAADPETTIDDQLPRLRALVLKDRDALEKGTKAFTSYIRAYKEHHCAFILRFASLDLGTLATAFCLLRLPKMPELKHVMLKHQGKLPNFEGAGPEVDIIAIPYRDKAREKARQERLAQEIAAGGKSAKLIKAELRKAEKKAKAEERRKTAVEKGRNPDKKRGKNARIVDDWDELAKEERLHKKLRRRKITQAEYDEQMDGL